MVTMLVERALQRARALLTRQRNLFEHPQMAVLGPALAHGADTSMPTPLDQAIWMAAPKSKVTPSRKRIRNNAPTKRLKNIVHLQTCEMCGEKKLRHRLCMNCFKKGTYFARTGGETSSAE